MLSVVRHITDSEMEAARAVRDLFLKEGEVTSDFNISDERPELMYNSPLTVALVALKELIDYDKLEEDKDKR